MTRRAGVTGILLMLGVIVAAMGLGRLRFDPDVLGMLPGEMPEVRGLQVFHEDHAREDELVILLESETGTAEGCAGHAESLAAALMDAGVAKRARWKPEWEAGADGLAELLAYLWLNGPEDVAVEKAAALSEARADETLERSLERVATALEGGDLVMRAHDPFGFLDHPSVAAMLGAAEEGSEGFESADGSAHLIIVESPERVHGYKEAGAWLEKVRGVISRWQETEGGGVWVTLTGEPAFSSEIGGAMERDMRGTVGITAGLIGLLFWWMQRRLALLAGLGGVLALVFATALGMAGWIYGELSIMAAGFAAILIGLAVDYGVLICQEAKVAGHDGGLLRRATSRSILWAAATTAAVFVALNFSGLPGIAQLGTMVGCGIVAGAVLMLGVYLPFVAKVGAGRPSPEGGRVWVPGRRAAVMTAVGAGVCALSLIAWLGAPGILFDARMMRPRNSEAMDGFERVGFHFPQWQNDDLKLVVEADGGGEMPARLAEAERRLAAHADLFESAVLPSDWWPDAERQRANGEALRALVAERDRLMRVADEVGFSEEGLALGRAMLDALEPMLGTDELAFPGSPAALEMMRMRVARRDDGQGSVLGTVVLRPDLDLSGDDFHKLRDMSGGGIWLTGWELLRPAVAPLVKKDLTHVFLPMALLMGVMLVLMFRAVRPVLAIFTAMALSGAILLAAMSALGIGWNFLNIAATPLLLGTGIDYGIHVLMALRRNGGDIAAMWHGTGKAVVFCGVSTAIGFGSLCFASNDALASLGAVAVIGILASMLVSVFLLPHWSGVAGSAGRTGRNGTADGRDGRG